MRYRITITGTEPLIMHDGATGLEPRSPANLEKKSITSKRGHKTEADDMRLRELETQTSLWLDLEGTPTIPRRVIRAMIEESARKLKEGPAVREGLVVESVNFTYDESLGADPKLSVKEKLGKTVQFTIGVVVQRSRILRTRAKFDKWGASFVVKVLPELIDKEKLTNWMNIGCQRIGIGDWRPSRSGEYGVFEVNSIEAIEEPKG